MERHWWEKDKFWGYILIAAGVAALMFQPFDKLDEFIRGETDYVITALMLVLAAGIVLVAFYARPVSKAYLLIWLLSP